MRKVIGLFLAFVMLIGVILPQNAVYANQSDWETAMNRSLDWVRDAVSPNPVVGSVGGEWAVIALARANRVTANDPWVTAWLSDLDRTLSEVDRVAASYDIHNPPSVGTFPGELRRWTDFQRVTLALSALGLDASNHNGRDLTEIYRSFVPGSARHSLNQTINVDTFALIALDTMPYNGDRDRFIQALIDGQRPDGTWSLSPSLPSSSFDLDITAMALQALAPYYYRGDARVTNAVERSLGWLRAQTFPDSESTSQMIVALTALGPAFADEAAFYVNLLLTWFDPASGGFRRDTAAEPVNLMATEQAAYALVAYWRFVNNMNSLYNMSDAFGAQIIPNIPIPQTPVVTQPATTQNGAEAVETMEVFGLPGKHADVRSIAITLPNKTFADIQNHPSRTAIEALAARDTIGGRNDTVFDPDATMTRAEFATVITRGLGLPARPAALFDDVPSSAWFAGAVGAAFYYEIVSGTTASSFNPNGTITRQDAAVMITRAARLTGMDTVLSDTETLNILAMFGDYRTASEWAWNALAFCYREGILCDSEFYIQPTQPISRGEIAEMLYQMLGRANLL